MFSMKYIEALVLDVPEQLLGLTIPKSGHVGSVEICYAYVLIAGYSKYGSTAYCVRPHHSMNGA